MDALDVERRRRRRGVLPALPRLDEHVDEAREGLDYAAHAR